MLIVRRTGSEMNSEDGLIGKELLGTVSRVLSIDGLFRMDLEGSVKNLHALLLSWKADCSILHITQPAGGGDVVPPPHT